MSLPQIRLKLTRKLVLITTNCLLLSACARFVSPASQSAHDQSLSWAARQQQLKQIKYWQINGAVAIQTPQKAFTASINWRQQSLSTYKINLFGPLGMGAVNLTGTAGKVTLYTNNQTYTATSPSHLLQQQLGWQLPVKNLYYWVRGLPAPGAKHTIRFDRFHHIVDLNQQGWQIRYLRYTGVGRYDLPSKIYLKNHYMNARLIVSSWRI